MTDRRWLLALLVVAVLLRLAPSTWDLPHLRSGDEWWGMHAGRALVTDEVPSFVQPPLHTWPGTVAAVAAPQAPPHQQLIIARLLCLWTLAVSLLGAGWLGAQLGGRGGRALAILFVALGGMQIRWGMSLDPDPALAALGLLAVASLLWLQRRGGEGGAVGAGALVGLAAGAKLTGLMLLPVAAWAAAVSPPASGSPDRRSSAAAAIVGLAAWVVGVGMLWTGAPAALARGGVVTPWMSTLWIGAAVGALGVGALFFALRGSRIARLDSRRPVTLGLAWGILGGLALALLPALEDPIGLLHATSDQLHATVGPSLRRRTPWQVVMQTPPIWILPIVLGGSAWIARRDVRPAEAVTLLGLPALLLLAILSADRVGDRYFLIVEALVLASAGGWLGGALPDAPKRFGKGAVAVVGALGLILVGTRWGMTEPTRNLTALRAPEAAALYDVLHADPGPLVLVPPAPGDAAYAERAPVDWILCLGASATPPGPPSASEQRRLDAARYVIARTGNLCLPFLRVGAEERTFGRWVLLDKGAPER